MTGRRGPQAAAGIAALLTLVALVGGLPVLLYRLGGSPLPGHLPGLAQVRHGLLHQESPDMFLAVVRDVSWLAWAAFTLAVLTEVQAVARRRTAPRLWLGGLQGAAGRLVALAALTFTAAPAGTLLATPQPVSAVTVVPQADVTAIPQAGIPQAARLVSGQLTAQPSAAAQQPEAPRHAAPEHAAPGHAAPEHAGPEHAGPEHAAPDHAAPQNTASTALPGGQGQGMSMGIFQLVTVRPGDCLWSIAQHYLGSGDRYQEIVQLNLGHDMGNGQRFRDPSVIQPGWVLHVPSPDAGGAPGSGSHGSGAHRSGAHGGSHTGGSHGGGAHAGGAQAGAGTAPTPVTRHTTTTSVTRTGRRRPAPAARALLARAVPARAVPASWPEFRPRAGRPGRSAARAAPFAAPGTTRWRCSWPSAAGCWPAGPPSAWPGCGTASARPGGAAAGSRCRPARPWPRPSSG